MSDKMSNQHIDTTERYSFSRINQCPTEEIEFFNETKLSTIYIHQGEAILEIRELSGEIQEVKLATGQGFVATPGCEYRLLTIKGFIAYVVSSNVVQGKPIFEIVDNGTIREEILLSGIKILKDVKKVQKPWGHELWIIWTRDYHVMKQIKMNKGNRSSLQIHKHKLETNYLESGEADLIEGFMVDPTWDAETMQKAVSEADLSKYVRKCAAGSYWTSHPGNVHRVTSISDYLAYEVSTPELDDVIRLSDDTARVSGRINSEHKSDNFIDLHHTENMQTDALVKLYLNEKAELLSNYPVKEISQAVELVWSAYINDKTIYALGNGGNAAYVANMITDLSMHPFVSDDKTKPLPAGIKRLRAINLAESPAAITAILNDIGADQIFGQQLINHMVKKDDVVFGFTGSGNSKNVLNALEIAKAFGATTIAITRGNGGKAKIVADLTIILPGTSNFPGQTGGNDFNFHYEDSLSTIAHMITGIIRQRVQRMYL